MAPILKKMAPHNFIWSYLIDIIQAVNSHSHHQRGTYIIAANKQAVFRWTISFDCWTYLFRCTILFRVSMG